MFTSHLHVAQGPHAHSLEVAAPGWLPAGRVLATALAGATGGTTHPDELATEDARAATDTRAQPDAATPPDPTAPSDELWAHHCAHNPVHAVATGLRLLPRSSAPAAGRAALEAASGPESGFCIEVPPGEWTVGRGEGHDVCLADPYLSRAGVPLTNSPRGIEIGPVPGDRPQTGSALLGATLLCSRGTSAAVPDGAEPGTEERADPKAHPAVSPDAEDHVFDWPLPAAVTPARPPSWVLFAVPLLIGLVLVLVTRMWWFLLFSLAGPLTALISARLERRRVAAETAAEDARVQAEAVRTAEALAAALLAFRRRLLGDAPPPGTIVLGYGRCVAPVGVRLPPDSADASAVRTQLPPHVRMGAVAHLLCEDVPLLVPVRTRVEVGGETRSVEAVVRALLAGLADAGIGCPPLPGMPEVAWTCGAAGLDDDSRAAGGEAQPLRAAVELAPDAAEGSLRARVGVVDGARTTAETGFAPSPEDARGQLRVILRLRGGAGLSEARFPAPGLLRRTLESSRNAGTRELWTTCGLPLSGTLAVHSHTAASHVRLLRTRLLSAGERPRPEIARLPPESSTTTELLALEEARARQTGGTPQAASRLTAVPLGTACPRPLPPRRAGGTPGRPARPDSETEEAPGGEGAGLGLVRADLLRHGPHALVAGTTGSGKSVLLEAWLELLCRMHTPQELSLVLLDFKGGAGLGRFASAPHTDALVTDLDEAAALRAVRSIGAEVKRREELLASAGAQDIEEYASCRGAVPEATRPRPAPSAGRPSSGAGAEANIALPPMPRLLVVIDEFHVLAGLSAKALAQVERLTALGRSLGIHLVLATQRPAGVVTAQMRANIALRICLRVRDEGDSQEVLGVPDAAWLSPALPGTALLSDGLGLHALRSGLPERTAGASPHIRIRDLMSGETAEVPVASETVTASGTATASETVTASAPPGPCHRIIAPPLPVVFRPEAARTTSASAALPTAPAAAPVALLDLPDSNRQEVWSVSGSSGTILISGARGQGWSTAAETLARAFRSIGECVVHIAAARNRQPPPAAPDTAGIPASGPCVDAAGILRLTTDAAWALDFVLRELERTPRPCRIVVDDWDELQRAHEGTGRAERFERLLSGGFGVRAVVTGTRRLLTHRIGQDAATRIIFPPHGDQDAVYYGLGVDRFAGTWPPGRAVVLGEAAAEAGRQGADAQLALCAPSPPGSTACSSRGAASHPAGHHPLWSAFAPSTAPSTAEPARDPAAPAQSAAEPAQAPVPVPAHPPSHEPAPIPRPDPARFAVPHSSEGEENRPGANQPGEVRLGLDPCGRPVLWRPHTQGRILAVRLAPGEGRSSSRLRTLMEPQGVSVLTDLDDPGQRRRIDAAAAGGDPVCLVLGPTRGTRPTPFDRGNDHGPSLLLGTWRESGLRALGLRDLPPIPAEAHAHWWLTDDGALPVRLGP